MRNKRIWFIDESSHKDKIKSMLNVLSSPTAMSKINKVLICTPPGKDWYPEALEIIKESKKELEVDVLDKEPQYVNILTKEQIKELFKLSSDTIDTTAVESDKDE